MTSRRSGRPLSTIAIMISCWALGRAAFIVNGKSTAVAVADSPIPKAGRLAAKPIDSQLQGAVQWRTSHDYAAPHQRERHVPLEPHVWPRVSSTERQRRFYRSVTFRDKAAFDAPGSFIFAVPNAHQQMTERRHAAPDPVDRKRPASPIARPQFPKPDANNNGNRVSLSAWILWRPNLRQSTAASALQLGGSQLGARSSYLVAAVAPAVTVNGYARFVMPIGQSTSKEAALGGSVKIGKLVPVELAVERRISVTRGGKNAWATVISSGVSDLAIGKSTSANIYVQTGIVGLQTRAKFVDGEASLMRALPDLHTTTAQLGLVIAGSAQSGLNRLDIGPILTLKPEFGDRTVRVSASWRVRALGNATPRTGFAISIGSDF